jgi:hypothetical protein
MIRDQAANGLQDAFDSFKATQMLAHINSLYCPYAWGELNPLHDNNYISQNVVELFMPCRPGW